MSEMRTNTKKGKKLRRIAAAALALVLVLTLGVSLTSMAAGGYATGQFKLELLDNATKDSETGNLTGATKTYRTPGDETSGLVSYDAQATFSKNVTVNAKVDKLFQAQSLKGVKRLELTFEGVDGTISSSNYLNIKVVDGSSTGNVKAGKWINVSPSKRYVYFSEDGIDENTFNTLMNGVQISATSKGLSSSSALSCKIVLRASSVTSVNMAENEVLGYDEDKGGTTYSSTVKLFTYATADLDESSVEVHAHNENPDKTAGSVSATFDMKVTNAGSGEYLRLGYQVKPANETWNEDNQEIYGLDNNDYAFYRGTQKKHGSGRHVWYTWEVSSGQKQYKALGTWDENTNVITNQKSVTITVTGLDPDKEYDIRGVVVTDNDTAAYTKAVSVPRISYTAPIIATLNTGSTADQKVSSEKTTYKEITAAIEYANRNYDEVGGPSLQADLYFTENRSTDETGKDNSTWKIVSSQTMTAETDEATGEYKTSINFTKVTHYLPMANTQKAAYKLVVTDLNTCTKDWNGNYNTSTGFSVTKYSDGVFTVDSSEPTQPQVTAGTFDQDKLTSGTAVVGGANSKVTLEISGSTDEGGSGLKEYSYNMFYIESDNITGFIRAYNKMVTAAGGSTTLSETGATNEQILNAMKNLTKSNYTDTLAEFTDDTSLGITDGKATLPIAKDGFYCINIKALDNVGFSSTATTVIFRVDTTPPNAPEIVLAKQKNNTADITGSTSNFTNQFEPYDNRTYTTSTVWVFAKTPELAGKNINKNSYEFSVDGGLTWTKITKVNHTTTGGTIKYYDSSMTEKSFEYDAAFKLSSDSITDYVTVQVRVYDEMENRSPLSNTAEMRTNVVVTPTVQMEHENIEIALAMGNTGLENAGLIQGDLRNLVAQKINAKYYGNSQDEMQKELAKHECKWANNSETCTEEDCPYEKYQKQGYTLYTPSMVNMQGLSSANAATDSSFNWVRFDHTNYISETVQLDEAAVGKENVTDNGDDTMTVVYPTVVFDNPTTMHTNADTLADGTHSTYTSSTGKKRYTAMTDYVVYTGQLMGTAVKGLDELIANGEEALTTYKTLTNEPWAGYMTHLWRQTEEDRAVQTNNWYRVTKLGRDTYYSAGRFAVGSGWGYGDSSCTVRRVYHMVDMTNMNEPTTVNGDTNAKYRKWNEETKKYDYVQYEVGQNKYTYNTASLAEVEGQAKMQTIYTLGYSSGSARDWLFLFNGQSTKKTIYFTADDRTIFTHANDAYGFWFNTTIRQNNAGEWVISGYMLLLGQLENYPYDCKYEKWIVYVQDMNLDYFANSSIGAQGAVVKHGESGARTDEINGEDFLYILVKQAIRNGGSKTYDDGSELQIIARSGWDNVPNAVRNYVMEIEGTKAEFYVYRAEVTDDKDEKGNVTKSATAKLQEKFESDKSNELTDVTQGYVKISWYGYKCVTADASIGVGTNTGVRLLENKETNPCTHTVGGDDTVISVPKPKVDDYAVGDLSIYHDDDTALIKSQPHTDSNCYGFGPITMARERTHTCDGDSLVIISNILMTVDKARSLSEVIAEPKWGGGKVKYILNVSDDSIADLEDPVLASTITWRVQNEGVKFITWGSLTNKETTDAFVTDKLESNGAYVVTRSTKYNGETVNYLNNANQQEHAKGQLEQTEDIAEYIANEYYKSYDMDTAGTGSDTAPDQLAQQVTKKGAVFDVENAKNLSFSISNSNLLTNTANDDFPSGRWYIAYDATGYAGRTSYAYFSDNLDLKATEPGRYSVYFAPDQTKLGENKNRPEDDSLNPDDETCIFDFVVNESAEANPVATLLTQDEGSLKTGQIKIEDYSVDPDTNSSISDSVTFRDGIQLTGIKATVWRWELSVPYTDPESNEKSSVVIMTSNGSTTVTRTSATFAMTSPYNGKTIQELTSEGKLVTSAGKYTSGSNSGNAWTTSSNKNYYTDVPTGATLTIYEKVIEANARRVYTGSKSRATADKTDDKQATFSTAVTYKALPDKTSAEKSTNLVRQDQGATAKPIRPSSAMSYSSLQLYDTSDDSEVITLTRESFQGQKKQLNLGWELTSTKLNAKDAALTFKDNGANTGWYYESTLVLKQVEAPGWNTTTGRASGTWEINKTMLKNLCTLGGEFSLRIIETVDEDKTVNDSSARTFYYKKDTAKPSAQSVTLEEGTYNADTEEWTYTDYQASGYLDMTKGSGQTGEKKIRVTVTGSSDNEGHVAGYGYYFYSKSGNKTTYYKLGTDGKLTSQTTAANALQILTNANNNVASTEKLTFDITADAMYLDGKLQTPMVSLNLAVFAYDNQTNVTGSLSGGNETATTNIEKIKLAKFTPTALALKAVNTTGQEVASIGHSGTQTGGTTAVNTSVTVSFTPKQSWYQYVEDGTPIKVTDKTILDELEKNGTYTDGKTYMKYFEDTSTAADLTNKVTVDYEIMYKAPDESDWAEQPESYAEDAAYTSTVTLTKDGEYEVYARAKNGSGVYSAETVLTFEIDRTAPTEPSVTIINDSKNQYSSGTWTKSASVTVSGSKDHDTEAVYKYSIDNGVAWTTGTKLGGGTKETTFDITTTGTHTLRVKAVDTAGNESKEFVTTVMVDATPPRISAPNVKASATSFTLYTESVVTINQTAGGVVHYIENYGEETEEINEVDEEIAVTTGETAYFLIQPNEGYIIRAVKLGSTAYSAEVLTEREDGYVFAAENLEGDCVLQVTFEEQQQAETESYMSSARVASFNSVRALRTASPETYANEYDGVDGVITYEMPTINHSDSSAYKSIPIWSGKTVTKGDPVTLSFTLFKQYALEKLEVTYAGNEGSSVEIPASEFKQTGNDYSYTFTSVDQEMTTVKVYTKEKIEVTISLEVEGHGTMSVSGANKNKDGTYSAYVGDTITLTATPDNAVRYKLTTLTVNVGENLVDGDALDEYTIQVPAAETKIYAEFTTSVPEEYQAKVEVSILKTDDGTHGTISPKGTLGEDRSETYGEEENQITRTYEVRTITLSNGDDQRIVFKPDARYTVGSVKYTASGDGATEQTLIPEPYGSNGEYSVLLDTVSGTDNKLTVQFVGKTHKITTSSVVVTSDEDTGTTVTSGGTIKINGVTASEATVNDGDTVEITITPDSGYRIEKVTLDGISQGNRRNLKLEDVTAAHDIEVTFSKKTYQTIKTMHTLTATAIGVNDGQEALADAPYRFKLDDGSEDAAFGDWQTATSTTYTDLSPNTKYTVVVSAKDKRGNETPENAILEASESQDANATEKYTWANVPAGVSVAEAEDTDNGLDKTVRITVNTMGNPSYTKYGVYYSDRADMRSRKLALVVKGGNASNPADCWSTLDDENVITVYGMSAGTRYYLQVVARNEDGEETEANDDAILEITLSPTAPPENSLYFEEQSAPGEGITLHWDKPSGDVTNFLIYRDGALIAELDNRQEEYTDPYAKLRGDGGYTYSYAYKNSSGVGARRTAVSKEYYDAATALKQAKTEDDKKTAQDKLDVMDALKGEYTNLYKETMTYPVFPAYYLKQLAISMGSNEDDGRMTLLILPESGTAARAEKFEVGLNAYEKIINDDDGSYTYKLVEDGTTYGNGKTWSTASTVQMTTCNSATGAYVMWKDLNINWEYRVYVKSVRSVGRKTTGDGYKTGSGIGMEEQLGRTYVVDSEGYYYYYQDAEKVGTTLTTPEKVKWTEDAKNKYTQAANDSYVNWTANGIELVSATAESADDNYIKFNKSPQVFIPTKDTESPDKGTDFNTEFLYGADSDGDGVTDYGNSIITAYGQDYLVAETDGKTTQVKLKVKVYDPDGPADGNYNYTVTGKLGGVTAKVVLQGTAEKDAVGKTVKTATECELVFNFKSLQTGVYDDLKLTVANGSTAIETSQNITNAVRVVVNKTYPSISADTSKKLESGRNYGLEGNSTLKVSTNLSASNKANLRKARVVLMADSYKTANLTEAAKCVLAGDATDADVTAIDNVKPSTVSYFRVSEEVYNSLVEQVPTKVMTTKPADITYYWVEKEYAFANNLCSFLTRGDDNTITAKYAEGDTAGTQYPVLVTSSFGSNMSTLNLRFQMMDQPSLQVLTEQTWEWMETTKEEYQAYEEKAKKNTSKQNSWTLADVYNEMVKRNALNDTNMTPVSKGFENPDTTSAYKQEDNKYYVFKLTDKAVNIQSTEVSGTVQVGAGMYDVINKAYVVLSKDTTAPFEDSDLNEDTITVDDSDKIKLASISYQSGSKLYDNAKATFRARGLTTDTTYYMWVYYQVTDPETGNKVWYHETNCNALTTESDYHISNIGFNEVSKTYEEANYQTAATTEIVSLVRSGDFGYSTVKASITAQYFEADEYGNLETDESGNPIEIKPGTDAYTKATNTLKLLTNEVTIDYTSTQAGVSYQIRNNTEQQGHMIVRLTVAVTESTPKDENTSGINRVTPGAEVLEIFVQDDESEITSYKIDIKDKSSITENAGDSHYNAKHYDYTFDGLPDPYEPSQFSSLDLQLVNVGEGALENITAELYDEDRKTKSTAFTFDTPLTTESLAVPDELNAGSYAALSVVPAENLADGVYEGWLKITADRVKTADVIWVHLYQVVGQVTLQGNIYIGSKPLSTTEFAGVSTVKVYSSTESAGTTNAPLYQTVTDENGYYEIPNILTNGSYAIVVERIGCASYDCLKEKWIWTPTESGTYQFDLEMVAGELYVTEGETPRINMYDREVLEQYMNTTVASAKGTELEDIVTKCDLNQDGIVNVLDRMLLWRYYYRGASVSGTIVPLYEKTLPTKTIG